MDDRLSKLLQGIYGFNNANDKRQNTLSLDSFMTIWLLNLPEKLNKWSLPVEPGHNRILNPAEKPYFSFFIEKDNTCLYKPPYGDKNPADILTKPLPQTKWYPIMKPILHWLDKETS